jgi:hypothetical protein
MRLRVVYAKQQNGRGGCRRVVAVRSTHERGPLFVPGLSMPVEQEIEDNVRCRFVRKQLRHCEVAEKESRIAAVRNCRAIQC